MPERKDERMRVLRLCSVLGAPPASLRASRSFDVLGGMQVHTARLTAGLDELGLDQTVITAYRPGAPRAQRLGRRAFVHRAGVPLRHVRQLYGVAPTRLRVGALGVALDPPVGEQRPAAMDRRPTAVFAGRLVPEKGVHEL